MKLIDLFKPILAKVITKPEELETLLAASDLKAAELPDEALTAFNNYYLTRDRAINDEEILKKVNSNLKGQVYGTIDQKFKPILKLLSAEDVITIEAEPNTVVKMELLEKAIGNIGKSEDIKKASEAFRVKETDYNKKIKGLEDEKKEILSTFDKRLKENKIDYALKNKLFAFELAPEFADNERRNFLAESTLTSLRKKYILDFDEKDESSVKIFTQGEGGALLEPFEGNTKLTLDDVLKKSYEPFTKKSNGNAPKDTPPPHQTKLPIKTDKPLTVEERRIAAAQGMTV